MAYLIKTHNGHSETVESRPTVLEGGVLRFLHRGELEVVLSPAFWESFAEIDEEHTEVPLIS